ncbi:BamA/TamA family outer membrane protein [Rubrivirga sp. S365]|uniref:BamA/TamA family outer membrane protein n=1 Tax=Rubrivirga litoralis TaxID=3075598 RepID=A0ABU3BMI8_9BACT|nr:MULTISPECIES: BamA/TamA family outer membrane protein [unclassified Rubrivirga]MDT0630510.1 BamA/TamA family outer membrane protein [Rubrivirga sp. F394]MDT7856875.1 BamA/TamA family outer membrane protein [Rubrivirga sp. S365]
MSWKIRLASAALLAAAAPPAAAQDAWTVRTAGADSVWTVAGGAAAALDTLAARGHAAARVDSVRGADVYVTAGPVSRVASVEIVGSEAAPPADLVAGWATREGAVYSARRFEADLGAAARALARLGYADAVLVPDVTAGEGGAVRVTVRVDEGAPADVAGVELVGARRPSRAFASRVAAVGPGALLADVDLGRVRAVLDATRLYDEVGEPVVARGADGRVVVQVPVREAAPGAFDLVVGFLPPSDGEPGQLVGNGRVNLRNPFGGGRALDVELVRNPGLASSLDVAARDPFVFGTPLAVGLGFEGTSRGEPVPFSRQRYAAELGYALAPGLSLVAGLTAETVRPGVVADSALAGGAVVRRSDALYVGAGVTLDRLDAPRNPRRGLALRLYAEQGRPRAASTDPTVVLEARARRRLDAAVRGYLPTFARQVAVLGLDARVVQGGTPTAEAPDGLDEGDLFRIGGAATLRGYDEEAFRGRAVGRLLAEYRLLFDADSYGVAFFDLGYVDRPALGAAPPETRVLPGYGLGVRVRTGLGLASVSYALSPDVPLGRGKVHVGLAVGL